jgi:hypothetical protein
VLLVARVIDRAVAGVRIGALRPSEKEDEWLGVMDAIVYPAARLLDSEVAPLFLREQATAHLGLTHIVIESLRKHDMSVLIEVIGIFLRVLNLIRVVRHFSLKFKLI